MLHPSVTGGDHTGVLAVHSLSKRSNLAGYRAGFVAGDPALVAELLEVRKHAGLIVPAPVQAADGGRARRRRARGRAAGPVRGPPRACCRPVLERPASPSSTPRPGSTCGRPADEDCWTTVDWLAERGILVAPGAFYGPAGERHVRVALTATDERVAAAAERLGA